MLSYLAKIFSSDKPPAVPATAAAATPAVELSTEVHRRHLERNLPQAGDEASLVQRWEPLMDPAKVRQEWEALRPEIPWCHFYRLGSDLLTVRPEQAKHFAKARALKTVADGLRDSLPYICRKQDISELSVLDLACAEGAHSIELAHAGAKRVVGVEGRQIYVDRAAFVARVAGLNNVSFQQGDVREVSRERLGGFDLVLFFGILHHLADRDYRPMLRKLYEVTDDTMVLFTHTCEPGWEAKFKLGEEVTTADGLRGRHYREHPDGATPEVKEARIRNSLDNTFSFWAREASLLAALREAGFRYVSRQLAPNPFDEPTDDYRVLYICRR